MVSIWAHYFRRQRCLCLFLGTPLVFVVSAKVAADEYDRPPINYSTAPADNPISRMQKRLDAGQAHLKYQGDQGYLRSLHKELDVPASSQMLVFSKTSM